MCIAEFDRRTLETRRMAAGWVGSKGSRPTYAKMFREAAARLQHASKPVNSCCLPGRSTSSWRRSIPKVSNADEACEHGEASLEQGSNHIRCRSSASATTANGLRPQPSTSTQRECTLGGRRLWFRCPRFARGAARSSTAWICWIAAAGAMGCVISRGLKRDPAGRTWG